MNEKSVLSVIHSIFELSDRVKHRFQQFIAIYGNGWQICCNWSRLKMGL